MESLQKTLHTFMQIGIVVVLVVPAIGLLAFGPRAVDSPPKDRVIVDYWEKWTDYEARAMQGIVDDFNRTEGKQKGIYVRYLSISGVEQKTLIATAAGVPPDIAGLYDSNVPQFAARDALLPLDELAAAHGITASQYKKAFWDECHYKGRLYALVSSAVDTALYYNTSKFTAAGLDPARPPLSIAQLTDDAKKMDVLGPSGNIVAVGYIPLEPDYMVNSFPYWFGGSWWDDKQQRFNFTDPHVIQAFNWVQSFPQRLGAGAMATFRSGFGNFDSGQNPFFAQTIAMEPNGTYFARFIQGRAPDLAGKWNVAAFPASDPALKDVTCCNADVLVIPRGAAHPSEAFEFMAYLNRRDVMEKLANLHGKISPLTDVSPGFLEHHTNPFIRVFDRLARSANAHATPPVPILTEVNEEMKNFEERLDLLQITPEQGLQEVQAHVQRKLEEFNEESRLRSLREE